MFIPRRRALEAAVRPRLDHAEEYLLQLAIELDVLLNGKTPT